MGTKLLDLESKSPTEMTLGTEIVPPDGGEIGNSLNCFSFLPRVSFNEK